MRWLNKLLQSGNVGPNKKGYEDCNNDIRLHNDDLRNKYETDLPTDVICGPMSDAPMYLNSKNAPIVDYEYYDENKKKYIQINRRIKYIGLTYATKKSGGRRRRTRRTKNKR
jgi:hypothetical protein